MQRSWSLQEANTSLDGKAWAPGGHSAQPGVSSGARRKTTLAQARLASRPRQVTRSKLGQNASGIARRGGSARREKGSSRALSRPSDSRCAESGRTAARPRGPLEAAA